MRKRVGHGGIGRCRQLHVAAQRQKWAAITEGEAADVAALFAAAAVAAAGDGLLAAAPAGVALPVAVVSVWLIWTSCSRLLTPTSCVMYCIGIGLRRGILILNFGDQQR